MPPKSKLAACVNCRQMKLKCDAHDRFPACCTRCAKHKLRCSIDPSFRRTAKRAYAKSYLLFLSPFIVDDFDRRYKELEEQVERLQGHTQPTESLASPAETSTVEPEAPTPQDAVSVPAPLLESTLPPTAWVGDVEVETATAVELLDIYYEHYQPRFPILHKRENLGRWYGHTPLLLGVVLAIAAGSNQTYAALKENLTPQVQRLAMDTVEAARYPSRAVQALLLLAWWPLSLDASVLNPSWSYCGLATHTALQFGLHRSQYPSDFRYRYGPDEEARGIMRRTWLACFIVNQSLSSNMGVPSTTPVDYTIISGVANPDPQLPLILQQYLEIAYHDYQIHQTLGNNPIHPTGQLENPSSLLPAFDRDLHQLSLKYGQTWHNATEIYYLKSRLALYSFPCVRILSSATTSSPSDTTTLSEAERTAERILTLGATDLADQSTLQPSSDIREAMTTSIFFLLKLLATAHPATNTALARDSLRHAWEVFTHASVRPTDRYARISSIIEYMLTAGAQNPRFVSSIQVQSRMSANISFDTAWAARERFPKHVLEGRPLDYTAAFAAEKQKQVEEGGEEGELLLDQNLLADLFGADLLGWDLMFGELLGPGQQQQQARV